MSDSGVEVEQIPPCPSCERLDMVVEAPEAGYWACERCDERGSGTEEPVWWRNDPDSQWYIPQEGKS